MLLLKLALTPVLIAVASLAGRRWGHAVSGWLVGLPLTSGPVALFLALERGPAFAAEATLGSLAGAIAEAAFCLAYAAVASRAPWPAALVAASAAFALVAAALHGVDLSLAGATLGAFATLAIALGLTPRTAAAPPPSPPPRWDVPTRMVIATALVLAITESAPVLGARVSGVLATFPVYAAILTVFAHREAPAPAVQVLRGLLWGLFGFAAFFATLGALLVRAGIGVAFAAAAGGALATQALSLRLALAPASAQQCVQGGNSRE